MHVLKLLRLVECGAALCALVGPGARGDDWNNKTVVTFGEPVEIPGQVLLAGTYVFKLADSIADRHIVEVWNADQTELITRLSTIPDDRSYPSNKPVFEFAEGAYDATQALVEWVYPGVTTGEQFVYPHHNFVRQSQLR